MALDKQKTKGSQNQHITKFSNKLEKYEKLYFCTARGVHGKLTGYPNQKLRPLVAQVFPSESGGWTTLQSQNVKFSIVILEF